MILALIQARMHSARLPGKSMALIEGVPLIEHVIRRVRATETPIDICVATTDTPADDPLAAHVQSLGFAGLFRGSEDDVLGRFFWAAERYPLAHAIVRVTADDAFKDPTLIDTAVNLFLGEWADQRPDVQPPHYLHLGGYSWPLGLDVEVFSREALTMAHQEATAPADREHVTPWISRTLGCWQLKNPYGRGSANDRWTIDEPADLEFARHVYSRLYAENPVFGFQDMLAAGYVA